MSTMVMETAEALFREITAVVDVPVTDGIQVQGDVCVIPLHEAGAVSFGVPKVVPAEGLVVVPAGRGGHEHRLLAGEAGTLRYAPQMTNRDRGNVGAFWCTKPAFLLHHDGAVAEGDHAMLGIAPGWYVIRQQRERAADGGSRFRRVCD